MTTAPRFPCFVFAAGWLAALILLLSSAPRVLAWNGTGHMMTAAIAYDQLPADARAKWTTLLKSHPDFDKWNQGVPKDAPGFDLGRYLFMRASTWPDDIRKSGSPYEHSVWHYVDYPIAPPDFPMEPAPTDTEDILSAIAKCRKIFADEAAAPVERAAHLSWFIHLIGDLQQPLHCVALMNEVYPRPLGDKGGNNFFISLAGSNVNLHTYWDNLPGSLMDGHEIEQRAAALEAKFPRATLPELTKADTPYLWSLEGRALAIEVAYRRDHLPSGHDINAILPALPPDYTPTARALADRRVALGGYRLADELKKAVTP